MNNSNKKHMTPEETTNKIDELRSLADQAAMKMETGKTLMGIDEAAEYLGRQKSYLYQLTCQKKIPFHKPNGKVIYFFKEEIDAWVYNNKSPVCSKK